MPLIGELFVGVAVAGVAVAGVAVAGVALGVLSPLCDTPGVPTGSAASSMPARLASEEDLEGFRV